MSGFNEPRTKCPNCNKSAPAMKYCIYCGARLPQVTPPIVSPPQQKIPPATPPTTPPSIPTALSTKNPPRLSTEKSEIATLMSGITTFYERKVALLDMFYSQQVSEKVFLKLYIEYGSKLKEFLKARATKLTESKRKITDQENRLVDLIMKLEELDVRNKLGEVNATIYGQQTKTLKIEEQDLVKSTKELRTSIADLENLLGDKKPNEIRDLEASLNTHQRTFNELVEKGKATKETLKAVKPDIEDTLTLFDSVIKERKKKDKELREQLEILQTRYKLSELSIEEYERRKGELQQEITEVWS